MIANSFHTLPSHTRKPSAVELMGVPLDGFTQNSLAHYLLSESLRGAGGYVVTHNLDHLRGIVRDPEWRASALNADVRVADGMPLIWASRIQGTPLPERIAGSDLVLTLAPALASAGRTLFLLGGEAGIANRAAEVLQDRFPQLRIVGTHCPPFGFENSEREIERIRTYLEDTQPDFVYVGLPFEKASIVAEALRDELESTWFLGVGISLSFICNEVVRAPKWLQKAGLEWLHRLVQEPRRLAKRYLAYGLPFALRLLASASSQRLRRVGQPAAANGVPESAPVQDSMPLGRQSDRRRRGMAPPGLIDFWASDAAESRLRALFVTNVWPDEIEPHWGVFVESQARSLEAAGAAIDVAVVRGPRSRRAYMVAPAALYGLSRGHAYDVIHVHAGHTLAVAAWTVRRPLVVSFFGADILGMPNGNGITAQSRVEALVFRQMARLADATITKSEEMERVLPPSVQRNNTVIPNGVDVHALAPLPRTEARQRLGWSQDEKVALFLCDEQDPRKNFALAKAAVRRAGAAHPELRLHSDFGLPHEQVKLLLSASDCLVFPSLGEGSPNLVKEAMAAELPIVATPVGDIPERLSGVSGCFVINADVDGFAAAIGEAIYLDRAPAAREAIMALSVEAVAQRVLNVYSLAISRRHRNQQPA